MCYASLAFVVLPTTVSANLAGSLSCFNASLYCFEKCAQTACKVWKSVNFMQMCLVCEEGIYS